MRHSREKRPKLTHWERDTRVRARRAMRAWVSGVALWALVLFVLVVLWQIVAGVRASVWDGEGRLTIVTATPTLSVFSFNPTARSALLLSVPDNLQIQSAFGYGQYPAGSLANLDMQEERQGQLITESVALTFGTIVDGQVTKMQNTKFKIKNKGDLMKLLGWGMVGKILPGIRTNVSLWDLVRLELDLFRLRPDKFETLAIQETNGVRLDYLPDGTSVYQVERTKMDHLSERLFVDENLAGEGLTVVVVNTTGATGLGGTVSRILNTVGMHVVAVEDRKSDLAHTLIVAPGTSQRKGGTAKLERWFGTEALERGEADSRGDVTVFLGNDVRERLIGD